MPDLHPLLDEDVVVALELAVLLEQAAAVSATAAKAVAVVVTLRNVVNPVSPFLGVRFVLEVSAGAADLGERVRQRHGDPAWLHADIVGRRWPIHEHRASDALNRDKSIDTARRGRPTVAA
jgi:hypothetical protein